MHVFLVILDDRSGQVCTMFCVSINEDLVLIDGDNLMLTFLERD